MEIRGMGNAQIKTQMYGKLLPSWCQLAIVIFTAHLATCLFHHLHWGKKKKSTVLLVLT